VSGREGVGLGGEVWVGGVEVRGVLQRVRGAVANSQRHKYECYDTEVEGDHQSWGG
jgi:hypothetical protein